MGRLLDSAGGPTVDDTGEYLDSRHLLHRPRAAARDVQCLIAPSMFEARVGGQEESPAQNVSVALWCWPERQSEGVSIKNLVPAAIPPVAHAEKYILPVAMVAIIPGFLFPQIGGLGVLSAAAAVAWTVSMLAVFVHDRGTALCFRCLEEIPGDSPQRAQRRELVLWFHHLTCRRGVLLVEVALFFAGPYVLIFALGLREAGSLLMAIGVLWGVSCAGATWQHRQLRPWCSFCRGGDDGGDYEPAPDPVTSGTKTVH